MLTWNRESNAIKNATRAVLAISDGAQHENVDMDLALLRSGSIEYSPSSSDVVFRMEVTGADQTKTTSESVRILRTRPSPMPEPGQQAQGSKGAPAPSPGEAHGRFERRRRSRFRVRPGAGGPGRGAARHHARKAVQHRVAFAETAPGASHGYARRAGGGPRRRGRVGGRSQSA